MRAKAEWVIDSEAIRARRIIVLVKSNLKKRLSLIVRVHVVLNRTVVVDGD